MTIKEKKSFYEELETIEEQIQDRLEYLYIQLANSQNQEKSEAENDGEASRWTKEQTESYQNKVNALEEILGRVNKW